MKDPSDRRVNRLILTGEGKGIVSRAYPLMMRRYELFVSSISGNELETITPILEKLYAAIKKKHQEELGR